MQKRPFKPQVYKSRGQNRSYNQGGYQNRSSRSDRGQYGNKRSRQNYRNNNFQGNTRGYGRQDNRGDYRDNRCTMNIIEAGMGQEKEHPQGIMVTIEIEVPVTVDQGQGLKLVLSEIG